MINATFSNISAISWRPVLVVKEAGVPGENHHHGQATGKLYHLRLRVKCTLICNLQSRARTHAVLVIGLDELLGNPTTYLIEPPGPLHVFDIILTFTANYTVYMFISQLISDHAPCMNVLCIAWMDILRTNADVQHVNADIIVSFLVEIITLIVFTKSKY